MININIGDITVVKHHLRLGKEYDGVEFTKEHAAVAGRLNKVIDIQEVNGTKIYFLQSSGKELPFTREMLLTIHHIP